MPESLRSLCALLEKVEKERLSEQSSCWVTPLLCLRTCASSCLTLSRDTRSRRGASTTPHFLTLRELAAIDGAFIVNRRGVVGSAGTYLDAQIGKGRLSPGLGARHAAALAITTVTNSTAVVISASSGTVLVYDDGQPILELEWAQAGSRT